MTETPKEGPPTGGAGTLDWEDPSDLPVEEVRDVFVTLAKALRAYQLYDPNNPVYQRFVSNLRDSFLRIWESREDLEILVQEERLTWMGEEVYRNENRSESISFLFYRDGIRDFSFLKGMEKEDLEQFLDALHRAKHARGEGDDLVTILWDLDLDSLRYTALDVVGDGMVIPSGNGEPAPLNVESILQEEVGGVEAPPEEGGEEGAEEAAPAAEAPDTVSQEDFNPTLYALDESEKEYVQGEIRKEMERDLREDVLNALFDRLEEPERPERQGEILDILRTLLPNLLSRSAVSHAARVVEEIQEMRGREGVFAGQVEELAERLMEDVSSEELVEELVRAMEDETVAPDAPPIRALLRHLRPRALPPLLKAAEESRVEEVQEVLREAIRGIAEENREALLRLLNFRDPSVAAGAVRLVAKLGMSEGVGALAGLLEDGPPPVRRAVVEASADLPSSVLQGALTRVLEDEDREIRIAAARVLGRAQYAPAADAFREVLNGKWIKEADVTEKVAFFEGYGMLTGEEGVSYVAKILNRKGFLGRREPAEMRAGAALALGKIGTPEARAALEEAREDPEPVVRSAVGRALRGEGGGGKEKGGEDG